jgi:hypothetical protein
MHRVGLEEITMNRWKSYVWMAAGLAALALACAFTARPLLAQIKAAFVQNVDEPGRIPYQSVVFFAQGGGGCSGPSCASCAGDFCTLNFAPVPNNKRLVVTSVIGLVYVDTPGVLKPIQLGSVFIPTVLQAGTFPGVVGVQTNIFGVNATGSLVSPIDGGNTPSINMVSTAQFSNSNGATNGQMTVTGYLVDCTAAGSCALIVR